MKKSDIEKRLQNDINTVAPDNFDALWKRCETEDIGRVKERSRQTVLAGAHGETTTNRRGLLTGVACIGLVVILALTFIFGAMAGWFTKKGGSFSKGYFILDINPSVEVDYDEQGNVTDVVGLNKDGKVLTYGTDLIGKPYAEALSTLFSRCLALGYFSADYESNAVLVSARTENGQADEQMTEMVRKVLSDQFIDKKIYGVALAGKDDPALKDDAESYGIDAQKYALICEYLQLANSLGAEIEITESEYATIPIREIYEEMEELKDEMAEHTIGEAFAEVLGTVVDELKTSVGETMHHERLEEELERLENAKTFVECRDCANRWIALLTEIAEREHLDFVVVGHIQSACERIRQELLSLDSGEQKHGASIEDIFTEREDKYRGNEDKQSHEPDGGFKAWQDDKETQMKDSPWKDIKKEWEKDRRD